MSKTLSDNDIELLRALLASVEYRLVTIDGQQLAEAAEGEILSTENSFQLQLEKELGEIKRIKELLGLPVHRSSPRTPADDPEPGVTSS